MLRLTLAALLISLPAIAAETFQTSAGSVRVDPVITGLDEPWAVAFLPDGGFLITERDGALLHTPPGGAPAKVAGVPDVRARGQGGLLDVVVARDFAASGEIFLTYSEPRQGGAGTALAVAKFDPGAQALTDIRVIFRQKFASGAGQHFGSRVVEANDGTLFLTIGDRGARDQAQDTGTHNGSVIRVNRDGSIPSDNPFVSGGGLPEIWSYGHRNPQGAGLSPDGTLWTVEHGARGGDEINRPEAGRNYGWPVISYGTHYSGAKIGVGAVAAGMEQPKYFWDPSIAPSGLMVYSGKLWPEWKDSVFVGSLKFNFVSRVDFGAGSPQEEQLFRDAFIRIRDIREAADGTIWFLSIGDGTLYRVSPA